MLKKVMKKDLLLFGLISFVMAFCLLINVHAITTDAEAPTITKLSIVESKDYNSGDIVYLNTDANDSVSGIRSMYIWVDLIVDESKPLTLDNARRYIYNPDIPFIDKALTVYFDGENKPYTFIPSVLPTGKYYVKEISLYDNNGNHQYYLSKDGYNLEKALFDKTIENRLKPFEWYISQYKLIETSMTFKVNQTDESKSVQPEIESVEIIGNSEVEYGNKISIKVKTKNSSNFSGNVVLSGESTISIPLEKQDDYWIGEYEVKKGTKAGKYDLKTISFVSALDDKGYVYIYYDEGASCSEKIRQYCKTDRYSINVKNVAGYVEDNEAPVINSISVSKTNYEIPSIGEIEIKATDKNSGLAELAFATFTKIDDETRKIEVDLHLIDGVYKGDIDIDQYNSIGEYYLSDVTISDTSENANFYQKGNGKYKTAQLEQDIKIKLTAAIKSDVITSTVDKELIAKIKAAADGAIISIDTTNNPIVSKEVFEAIKNTNKEIHLECEGIEWIFKGKDITEPKDIDTSFLIMYSSDFSDIKKYLDNSLVLKFADNGKLPGKARVTIKLDYAFRNYVGKDLNVFFYDGKDSKSKYFKFIKESLNQNKNGFYEFEIDHNSMYILSSEKPEDKYVDDSIVKEHKKAELQKASRGKTNFIIIIGGVVALAVVVALLIIVNKRKKQIKTE